MRIFKLVLTTLFIFISLNTHCAFSYQNAPIDTNLRIESLKSNKETIEEKNTRTPVIMSNRTNSQIISSRRNENNNVNSSDTTLFTPNNQAKKLIKYIKNQIYLGNNIELALLPLLHQIQPNAP